MSIPLESPVNPFPKPSEITWEHPNGTVLKNESRYSISGDGLTLTIVGVLQSDDGLYTVSVSNVVGFDTQMLNLTVYGKLASPGVYFRENWTGNKLLFERILRLERKKDEAGKKSPVSGCQGGASNKIHPLRVLPKSFSRSRIPVTSATRSITPDGYIRHRLQRWSFWWQIYLSYGTWQANWKRRSPSMLCPGEFNAFMISVPATVKNEYRNKFVATASFTTEVYHQATSKMVLLRQDVCHAKPCRFINRFWEIKCGIFAFKLAFQKNSNCLPRHVLEAAETWLSLAPDRISDMNSCSQSRTFAIRLPRPRTNTMKSSPFYFCFSVLNSVPLDNLKSEASVKEYLLSGQWFDLHVHSISLIVPVLSCLFLLSSFTLALAIGCSNE